MVQGGGEGVQLGQFLGCGRFFTQVGLRVLECVCAWCCKGGRYVAIDGAYMLSCVAVCSPLCFYPVTSWCICRGCNCAFKV